MIRHLDVINNPVRIGREDKPYLVCVQHDRLSQLRTRILAPLVTRRAVLDQPRLYPDIRLGKQTVYFDSTELVTLEVRRLGKPIANLKVEGFRITAALDLVFTGI